MNWPHRIDTKKHPLWENSKAGSAFSMSGKKGMPRYSTEVKLEAVRTLSQKRWAFSTQGEVFFHVTIISEVEE